MGGVANQKKPTGPTVVVPPDGGWGWMVVLGSFLIHVIADGITYSFGVIIQELLSTFKETKGATSWIISIMIAFTLGSGLCFSFASLQCAVFHLFTNAACLVMNQFKLFENRLRMFHFERSKTIFFNLFLRNLEKCVFSNGRNSVFYDENVFDLSFLSAM